MKKGSKRKGTRKDYCLCLLGRCTLVGDARDWHMFPHLRYFFLFFYFNIHCHETSTHHIHISYSDLHNDVHTDLFAHKLTHKPLYTLCLPGSNTVSTSSLFPPLLVPTERCHHPLSPKACLHPGHFFRWPGKSRPAGGVRSQSQPFTAAPATAC